MSDLIYAEELIPCCELESGTGLPLRLGLIGEQWVTPKLAVQAAVGVTFQSSSFTALSEVFPTTEFGDVQTEYQWDMSYTQIMLSVGARQRLISFLSLGVDLRGLILAGRSESLTERIVRGDGYQFFPPAQEIVFDDLEVTQMSAFVLEPSVSLQYDIALGLGTVLSPSVNLSMPLNSLSTEGSWRYLGLGVGVRLSRGL